MKLIAVLCFLGMILLPFLARADALDQWMTRTTPVPVLTIHEVIYAKGLFVAVASGAKPGEPRLIVSSNGVDWVRFVSFAQFSLRSITYGSNGLFVAVGRTDIYDGTTRPGIIASTNGTNWSYFPTFGTQFGAKTNFEAVTYGNGLFVAVGEGGTVATSADGTNWATHTTPTSYSLSAIAYGNGVWVAAGPRVSEGSSADTGGPRLISLDATNWVQLDTDFNGAHLLFARGRFLAIAGDTFTTNAGPMRYSVDGTNWTDIAEPTTNFLRNVTYGGGLFTAVGRDVIKTSLDGTNWVRRFPANSDVTNRLLSVAYGANTFVAVGDVILQSEDIRPRMGIAPAPFSDFALWQFTLRGLSNALYRIQSTTNAVDWVPGNFIRADGSEQNGPGIPALPLHKFYRAVHVPE